MKKLKKHAKKVPQDHQKNKDNILTQEKSGMHSRSEFKPWKLNTLDGV